MGTFLGRNTVVAAMVAVCALALASGAAGQHRAARQSKDTSLPTWQNLYDWSNGSGYVGWHSSTTAPDDFGLQTALGDRYGLWLWPLGGHKTYDTSDYAEWTYTAPGSTRLESATLSYAWSNKLLAHHCIDVGLRTLDGTIVTQDELCQPPPQSPRTLTLTDPSADPTSTVLFFRIHVDCGGAQTCDKTIPALDPLAEGAFARLLHVDMTLVDDDNPVAWGAGAWFDLADDYVNGQSSYGLTLNASDAGSGITGVSLARTGAGEIFSSPAPCDPTHHTDALDARICPPSYSADTTIDTSTLPEGRNEFSVHAADVAGNTGAGDPWSVYVDRTPPDPASSITNEFYDPSTGDWAIQWDPGSDPDLADGSPGSGVTQSEYRYAVDGGGFTDWQATDNAELVIPSANVGDTATVDVIQIDAVGNESATAEETLTLDASVGGPPVDQPPPPQFCKDPTDPATCEFDAPQQDAQVHADSLSQAGSGDPPSVTRSYYEHDANVSTIGAQGCTAGKSTARGVAILDFGRPAYNGGVYGTIPIFRNTFISMTAIQKASLAFTQGFLRCSHGRGGLLLVAVGTNNSCSNNDPACHGGEQPPSFDTAGRRWSAAVEGVQNWIDHTTYYRRGVVSAAGADDTEPAWEGKSKTATHTTAFNDGFNAVARSLFFDYGSDEGGFWDQPVRYHLAWGLPHNVAIPQIYLDTQLANWQELSKWGDTNGRYGRIRFIGVLSQYNPAVKDDPQFGPHCGLTPQDGYNHFVQKLDADKQTAQPNPLFLSNIVCRT